MSKYFANLKNLLPIVFVALSISILKSSYNIWQSNKRFDDLQKEVLDLRNKKKDLENDVAYKSTEEYVEQKARDDLNLIKPGEKLFVIERKSEDTSDTVLADSVARQKDIKEKREATWYLWYKLFF